ncbi:ATP-binding protein [Phocaeicola sp.]
MSHALFQPITDRADEIVDFLMHTEEVLAHPSLAYSIRLSCEEIIVNIISYAYPAGTAGYIWLNVTKEKKCLRIEIRDGGVPFNPIERQDPDISQELEEREIGGLGIFLVLQNMDNVEYRYEEGENKLILRKKIEDGGSNG